MPTQSTTYNTRLTDETLEKRFRDTFRSQSGAELVDDLYASGVIVPIVDFTAAAEGSFLRADLQAAWDFSTGFQRVQNATRTSIISNAGFWSVQVNSYLAFNETGLQYVELEIFDGQSTYKRIFELIEDTIATPANVANALDTTHLVVFLRSGDSLLATASDDAGVSISYRQLASVSGDLVNPTGFTSS